MPRILSILVLFPLLTIGCARNNDGTWKAPLIYRVDIQQGNVVDQSMLNKLKPGMDKKQVKYIMGTPLITDTFHSDRWDYVYSFEPGRGEREQRRVTLFFKEDKLERVAGDIKVSDKPLVEEDTHKDRLVEVPLEENKAGMFKRWFGRDKDEKNAIAEDDDSTSATETPAPEVTDGPETGTGATGLPEDAATTEIQEQDTGESGGKPHAAPAVTATSNANEKTGDSSAASTAGDTQEKNLLRRFWDRMTKGGDEGDVEMETEQDRRDAKVLEGAGGDL